MVKFHVRKLPFMLPVVVVVGFILWKWANGSDSPDPNLDCRIGSKVFADGFSHCFTNIWKLDNRRSSERLRCFNSSKGTNLAILIILAGDIETNPGLRSRCSLCKKYCKVSDKVIECTDCQKRFDAKCFILRADDLLKIETGNSDRYCKNCKVDCGLCSGAVLSVHKAVQCEGCEMCSFITEAEYENVLKSCCTWICPKCEFFNFSDSFFVDQSNLMIQNRFDPPTKEQNDRISSIRTNQTNSLGRLKFISLNINSIRGKKLDLLAFLEVDNPHIVAIQETKIDSSIATSELFPETCPYNIFRNLHGGGVMLLIHKDIPHMP